MENFVDTTKFLLELSRKASEIILKHYSAAGVVAEMKGILDPVTIADIEVNKMVLEEIGKKYPDYGVWAEEESTETDGIHKLFVVDPIDGTQMFEIGCPLFTFSAAQVIASEVVAGLICNPLAKRTLLAEKDKGAYLVEENKKISVSNQATFDRAIINSGWFETALPKLLHEQGARTLMVYSICEAASLVATGGIDGATYTSHHPYDIAAAKIIIEEAGGKVTDLHGNEQRYDRSLNGAIITNGLLHEGLLELSKKAGMKMQQHNK
jgi:histidinol-phosphatase